MTVTDTFHSRSAPASDNIHYSIAAELHSPRIVVLRASGELDMRARADLVESLDDVLRGETVVLLDLSAVSFMDAGSATVIVEAAARAGDRLEVFAPTRPARRILDVLGAAAIMCDSRAA
ncbi:STAS domain-containing protein [Rhodococcus sp. 077-4]|uniref:STAS domain-containing protein n=1 Tax=Rhodococcus sp. 077-4 TaxID=2789271 RepID=UPI0039F45D7F